jgi:hypothetical protein
MSSGFKPDVIVPGRVAPDVIFTWSSECLVQEHVYRLLCDNRITGFWTKPATAKLKRTGESVDVRELCVSGWGGLASPESGIREIERCAVCGYLRYSSVVNPDKLVDQKNWDGSDFFLVWPLPGFVFVTEKVVNLFSRHKLTGAQFVQKFPPSVF